MHKYVLMLLVSLLLMLLLSFVSMQLLRLQLLFFYGSYLL